MYKLMKYHSNTRALLSKINLSGIEILLCGVGWYLVTSISGWQIVPIFRGPAVHEEPSWTACSRFKCGLWLYKSAV